MPSALDDRTVAYVVAAQPVFEDLRQVAAQLAGLLVLAATGSKESSPDHPMLGASKQVLAHAEEGANRLGALITEPARAHHHRLVPAHAALQRAIRAPDGWPLDIDSVMRPLAQAYSH